MTALRMPIVDEKAPRECDFDAMLSELKGTDANTACVFNCQMGKGRTTTGMIVACLIRDVLGANMPSYPPMQVITLTYKLCTGFTVVFIYFLFYFRLIRTSFQMKKNSWMSSTSLATSR